MKPTHVPALVSTLGELLATDMASIGFLPSVNPRVSRELFLPVEALVAAGTVIRSLARVRPQVPLNIGQTAVRPTAVRTRVSRQRFCVLPLVHVVLGAVAKRHAALGAEERSLPRVGLHVLGEHRRGGEHLPTLIAEVLFSRQVELLVSQHFGVVEEGPPAVGADHRLLPFVVREVSRQLLQVSESLVAPGAQVGFNFLELSQLLGRFERRLRLGRLQLEFRAFGCPPLPGVDPPVPLQVVVLAESLPTVEAGERFFSGVSSKVPLHPCSSSEAPGTDGARPGFPGDHRPCRETRISLFSISVIVIFWVFRVRVQVVDVSQVSL